MSKTTIPIAEVFTSIHGEGYWAGTPMTFFRLAGCSVGKFMGAVASGLVKNDFPILPTGTRAWECTTFDGRKFPCDTDFFQNDGLSAEELIKKIPPNIKHVCITGGEPLIHINTLLQTRLVERLILNGITVHFETSGTIDPPIEWKGTEHIWWACSPKAGYLPHFVSMLADEVRIMVDGNEVEDELKALVSFAGVGAKIYFCPISSPADVLRFDLKSMNAAMDYTHRFPHTRISIQMHKVLGVR